MSLNVVIFVISALLLVQSTLSRPNTTEIVVSNRNRNILLHYAAGQIYAELNDSLSKTCEMFESARYHFNTIHFTGDNAANELKTSLVTVYEFINITKKIEKANEEELKICSVDLEQKFDFHQEVERNLTKFDYSKEENPLFNYIFTNSGLSQLKPNYLTKIKAFLQEFTIRADEYWNSLWSADSIFKNWYEQFKTEQDIAKKLYMFFELFKKYNYKYELQCPGIEKWSN